MSPFDILTNAVRAKEIASVFARHGFAEFFQQINPPPGFLQRIIPQPRHRLSVWERLRLAAEELGPTFVKTGQLLSMRPDVIPEPLVFELRKLQDAVKPLPFDEMRPVLVEELGEAFEGIFSEFDRTPIASASLAQVYRARLAANGRLVAVKLQRPNLRKLVDADLDLISFFATQLHARVAALAPYNLPTVVAEIRVAFARELDFRNESKNLRYFNATNPFAETVFGPEVHEAYTRERVLVMDFIEGVRLDQATLPPEQAHRLAVDGARSLFHQVLAAGFFHADPHAGNLLVTPDGRICVLDWGQVGQLTRRMRHFLAELFEAASALDAERIVNAASVLAAPHRRPDFRAMEKEVTFALRDNLNYAIGHQEIGRIILSLLNIFGRHGINVAQDYSLMAKAVLSIEEAARSMDPTFDLRQAAEPVLRDLQRERFSPRVLARQLRRGFAGAMTRLGDLPVDLHRLAQRVSQDDLTINFQHRGLEDLDDAINKAASRLTLAIIVGALIVGSSLIIHAGVKPSVLGYSTLGVTGYLLSMVIGLWIVWDIFRHGRHK
ncbi:MAG: AarF/UbiB family protein [Opitutaceae bacterium]